MATDGKAQGAFRTIGEVSTELGVPQHVLRYWESRFPQLKPLTRAGNRRYYRPADVALARRIRSLLGDQGYTMRGVQQLLAGERSVAGTAPETTSRAAHGELAAIRDMLVAALDRDAAAGEPMQAR